ncbi:MAG: hypothetical protein Q9227_006885 [Pyrenula ochraceoflavens]
MEGKGQEGLTAKERTGGRGGKEQQEKERTRDKKEEERRGFDIGTPACGLLTVEHWHKKYLHRILSARIARKEEEGNELHVAEQMMSTLGKSQSEGYHMLYKHPDPEQKNPNYADDLENRDWQSLSEVENRISEGRVKIGYPAFQKAALASYFDTLRPAL